MRFNLCLKEPLIISFQSGPPGFDPECDLELVAPGVRRQHRSNSARLNHPRRDSNQR